MEDPGGSLFDVPGYDPTLEPGWRAVEPEPDWDAAAFEVEVQAHLDGLSAAERAGVEFGLDPVAVSVPVVGASVEEAAVAAQARLLQADRVQRIAEAHRVAALVSAWEASIEDLRVRYGREIGSRQGLGGAAFFRSVGLRLQLSPFTVASMVDTAVTARNRLPLTWAVLMSGGTTWQRVRIVVKQGEGLAGALWPAYDAVAARLVVGSSRLKDDLHAERERLQPDTADVRARSTFERRAVYLDTGPDGEASLCISGPAADQVGADEALTRLAVAAHGVDGETKSMQQLRYDIHRDALKAGLALMADPDAAVPQRQPVKVQVVLTIPALAWLGVTKEQAILSGYGPIAMSVAKDLAGSATSMIRVLTDPVTGVRLAMDRTVYAPPADLRRWVQIRDGRSRFPGATRAAWLCDIDHAREWQHHGPTSDWNLITLDRAAHLAKSAGLFREELQANGIVHWEGPWGERFDDPPPDPLDPAPPHLLPPDPPTGDDPGDDPPF